MSQDVPMLLSKFQGCLISAVAGDCLGAYYEGRDTVNTKRLTEFFATTAKDETRQHSFTDDTAMARSVAQSLIEKQGFDVEDMARRFTSEYFTEPLRGYGGSVGRVFQQLKEEEFVHPHGPASNQFEGQGSYGNGGAMRIAPAALYCHNNSRDKLNTLVDGVTRITHSHPDAINGAILECSAIVQALNTPHNNKLVPAEMIDSLLSCMNALEPKTDCEEVSTTTNDTAETSESHGAEEQASRAQDKASDSRAQDDVSYSIRAEDEGCDSLRAEDEGFDSLRAEDESGEPPEKLPRKKLKWLRETSQPYCAKLRRMKTYLAENTPLTDVVYELGNNISALGSVPSAVFSFLKCLDPASEDELQISNPIERTLYLAISLGGDTDTIATMAGAIAGAYYGLEAVPSSWIKSCEGAEHAMNQAEALYKMTAHQTQISEDKTHVI